MAIALIRLRLWLRIQAAVRASTPLQIPAAVEIRSCPDLLEPGVVGLWQPIVLLPEGIVERLTPSQLEAVLAHELWHVRRRDNLFASMHMIVEAVFWFHPLVWWIGARLVEERERACDEGVLSLGSEPRTYADAILNVCKLYVESPLECVAGVTGANLKRRIEAIMTNCTGQGLNRARKLLLAARRGRGCGRPGRDRCIDRRRQCACNPRPAAGRRSSSGSSGRPTDCAARRGQSAGIQPRRRPRLRQRRSSIGTAVWWPCSSISTR